MDEKAEQCAVIRERFRVALKNKGITQQELADISKASVRTISRISSDGFISAATAEKIAPFLGVSDSYLRARSDDPTTRQSESTVIVKSTSRLATDAVPFTEAIGEEPAWIPIVEPHVCAGGGNGYCEIDWEPVGKYPIIPADLIGISWHSGTLRIIRVDGNSMEPRYRDGDMVIFSEESVNSGDNIIALWDGRLFLRGYVVDKQSGYYRLRALNSIYADIVIHPEDERFQPLGKVVGKVGRVEPDTGFW